MGGHVTVPLPVGPLTPYITPRLLRQYPTGISWASIPAGGKTRNISPAERLAAQANICGTATAMADAVAHQPLRATVDPLMLYGPGTRVGLKPNAPAELIMTRWPVLEVLSIQVSPNCLPYVWSPVPPEAYRVKNPVVGLYDSVAPGNAGEGSQTVLLDPCWLQGGPSGGRGWGRGCGGRNSTALQVQYVNGSPHCGTTEDAAQGAGTLAVDDCTAWMITSTFTGQPAGAVGIVYDASYQEVVQITGASAVQGPGTLTLASPLAFPHEAGVMVSTLPQSVVWATALFAVSIALERGATSTSVQEIPGKTIADAAGIKGPGGPAEWAKCILKGTFDRII
jgi:hypothetical protein